MERMLLTAKETDISANSNDKVLVMPIMNKSPETKFEVNNEERDEKWGYKPPSDPNPSNMNPEYNIPRMNFDIPWYKTAQRHIYTMVMQWYAEIVCQKSILTIKKSAPHIVNGRTV